MGKLPIFFQNMGKFNLINLVDDKKMYSEKERILMDYIYRNPKCSYSNLNKDLKNQYDLKRRSISRKIELLERSNHIISHGKRIHDGIEYTDIFTVNLSKIHLYPDLFVNILREITLKYKSIIETEDECQIKLRFFSNFYKNIRIAFFKRNYFNDYLENKGKEILGKIAYNPNGNRDLFAKNELIFSPENQFKTLEMLGDFFYQLIFNNSEILDTIQTPEDLDSVIIINTNFSNIPELFSLLKDKKEHSDKDFELLYAKAKLESEKGLTSDYFEKKFKRSLKEKMKLLRKLMRNSEITFWKLEELDKKKEVILNGLFESKNKKDRIDLINKIKNFVYIPPELIKQLEIKV